MKSIAGIDPATGLPITVRVAADGSIAGIAPGGDPSDLYLCAGLVDLQVNGYGGIDLNDGRLDPGTVGRLARALLPTGVTRFLPTLITASPEALCDALAAIAAAVGADPLVAAMVAGIHVEGPFLSPEDGPRGAHPRTHVRPPDLAEFDAWQRASGGRVRLVTLSPHWPDAPAFVAEATRRGVVVALGHTDATPAQIRAAADAGARLSTHLGNGVAAVLPRHPNAIWAQLADDRLTATFIADGHHLPADTLEVMLRAKGPDRAILVSDAAALAGMPPGRYEAPIGGQVEVSADGRLGIAGTPYLAGAARGLAEDVAIAARITGRPLAAMLPLATANPGRIAGGGLLAPGERADLLRFGHAAGDARLAIAEVWLAGERVA
jgi:N-acetylglucosamine-6-phosphate deacetylase